MIIVPVVTSIGATQGTFNATLADHTCLRKEHGSVFPVIDGVPYSSMAIFYIEYPAYPGEHADHAPIIFSGPCNGNDLE